MSLTGLASLGRISRFEESHPHGILGPLPLGEGRYRIAAYLPGISRAWLEPASGAGTRHEMELRDVPGIFTVETDYDLVEEGYLVCYTDDSGYTEKRADPYAFRPELSDFDIFLFRKGELYRSYETLGAHPATRSGVDGVRFVVWAPAAGAVSVTGNFNHWTRGMHPMTNVSDSGLWEVFIPGLREDEVYKYAIRVGKDGGIVEKADPYSFRNELRPRTASIVSADEYRWNDSAWIAERGKHDYRHEALSIYEVHLGSWRKPGEKGRTFLSLAEMGQDLVEYVRDLGFTHIELMPIMEHPFDGSWGYQVLNYYAPTSRYGTPADYRNFIDLCHRSGIGVILDWVPAHFPDDEYGLSMFDGTHLYDHEDPRIGLHPDWNTRIFNYGRPEVRDFLISNALFWIDRYHADGIRIDAVSSMLYLDYSRKEGEWIPNRYGGNENIDAISFLRELNVVLHREFPGVLTVAEESTAWGGVTRPAELGGLGFDFKWNMGWMHDTLHYFSKDPVYRKFEHDRLTFSIWYAFSENYILPFSHDEVVHLKGSLYGKMPGDQWQKFANLRLCFLYMFSSPGKKLMFMGDEFGQSGEWSESGELSWDESSMKERRELVDLLRDLNSMYSSITAMHRLDTSSEGFQWIDFHDSSQSVIAYMRMSGDETDDLVFVLNFTPVPRYNYAIGVPEDGPYREIFNTDSARYGGSGIANDSPVRASSLPFHGRPHSIELTLPPLGGIILKHAKEDE